MIVGTLAAAACTGAMLGIGIRGGVPSRGFNAIAVIAIGDAARGVWGWHSRVTPIGIAVLALVMFAWGALFAVLARRTSGWPTIAWAVSVAAGALLFDATIATRRLAGDAIGILTSGQVLGLHIVLVVTLVVGMRFALGGAGDRQVDVSPGS